MSIHAVVSFLDNFNKIESVDLEFLGLVKLFHQIPFCATFGVSCAGHFDDVGSYEDFSNLFLSNMDGSLDIIVLKTEPHISILLEILTREISKDPDSSFKKIYHIFGPQKEDNSNTEVWEIRIGDNKSTPEDYMMQWLEKETNQEIYEKSKKRYEEVKLFWQNLENTVKDFCEKNNFTEFDIEKRISEITKNW